MKTTISFLKSIGIMSLFLLFGILMQFISFKNETIHLAIIAIAFIGGVYFWYRHFNPKRRYYFVSFKHGNIFSCTTICTNEKGFIMMSVSNFLKTTYYPESHRKVVILYYKEISKEENELNTEKNENNN